MMNHICVNFSLIFYCHSSKLQVPYGSVTSTDKQIDPTVYLRCYLTNEEKTKTLLDFRSCFIQSSVVSVDVSTSCAGKRYC